MNSVLVAQIRKSIQSIYERRGRDVPFHNWGHVDFVASVAVSVADELGADRLLVETASYVHDLNYLEDGGSSASAGRRMRERALIAIGVDGATIDAIEEIVVSASTSNRTRNISAESKALSDGDTAFKALATTPLLTLLFLRETGMRIRELAEMIVKEQELLMSEGIYFYSGSAKREYGPSGERNLTLWRDVIRTLDSKPDLAHLFLDPNYSPPEVRGTRD